MELQVTVTSRRTVGECTVEEKVVIGNPPKTMGLGISLLSLAALDPRNHQASAQTTAPDATSQSTDDQGNVPGTAEDMADALQAISKELGCANTEEDILHAIDALRACAPQSLEWSDTLCDGKRVDHATAEQACAALGEGWRLPTRQELESILDLSRHEPAIDPDRFPNTKSGSYWTSTPCAWASSCAWVVNFYHGGVYGSLRRDSGSAFVRAVRSAPAGQ